MTARNVITGAAAAAVVALLLGIAWHSQRVLEVGLPPRVVCVDRLAAEVRAHAYAEARGGMVVPVLGTGSMAPYIPPAPAGVDPLKTVVAFAVTDPASSYAAIKPGNLCIYRAAWYPGHSVMHGAAQLDGDGWIMSGLHNRHAEAGSRVTPANFIALVGAVFVWEP